MRMYEHTKKLLLVQEALDDRFVGTMMRYAGAFRWRSTGRPIVRRTSPNALQKRPSRVGRS